MWTRLLKRHGPTRPSVSQPESLYSHLEKQDLIRLIKLDPKAPFTRDGYTVETFPLKNAPSYHALSYCWGSPNRSANIICNGMPLKISKQLLQGLKELQTIAELSGKWLWIDQISVNQDDLDERAHQVGLMQHIYSGSDSTVIWLGPQNGKCEAAFSLMGKISRIAQSDPGTNVTWAKCAFPMADHIEEYDFVRLGLPNYAHPVWRETINLLERPWFRRMWIIQEVLLSKKPPMLVYGFKTREWQHVLWSGAWLNEKLITNGHPTLRNDHTQPLRAIFTIWNSSNPWELGALLLETRKCLLTDLRDRCFALLSLAAETKEGNSYPPELEADYTKSICQVYRDFTTYCISASHELILLYYCHWAPDSTCEQDGHNGTTWPSWVPKLEENFIPVVAQFILRSNSSNRIQYSTLEVLKASHNKLALLQKLKDPNCIALQGLRMEKVSWISHKSPSKGTPYNVYSWCGEAARMLVPSRFQTLQSFLDEFLRTLRFIGPSPLTIPSAQDFWAYFDEMPKPNRKHFLKQFLEDSRAVENGDPRIMASAMSFNTLNINLYITDTQAIGFGPDGMEIGDDVCVLFGGQAPFVLRQCRDHFHLIGGSYCSGLTEGEAIDKWEAGHIEPEWFTLR